MVVQILGEDVYWIDEHYAPAIAKRGRQLVEAAHLDEPLLFSSLLQELVKLVHVHGQPVPAEEFTPPNLEIPTPQTPLDEAGLSLEQALSSL